MEDIQMGVIRAMKKRLLLLIIAVLAVVVFAGCGGRKTDTNGDITGDVETLLHALLTCPNDELYDSEGTYISLDDSEVGSTEEDLERDKNAWKEAIGGCFAEDRFDTFYGQWERTAFLGEAYIQGDSIELNDIKIEDDILHIINKFKILNSVGYCSITSGWNIRGCELMIISLCYF